jgi:hypothetical protein
MSTFSDRTLPLFWHKLLCLLYVEIVYVSTQKEHKNLCPFRWQFNVKCDGHFMFLSCTTNLILKFQIRFSTGLPYLAWPLLLWFRSNLHLPVVYRYKNDWSYKNILITQLLARTHVHHQLNPNFHFGSYCLLIDPVVWNSLNNMSAELIALNHKNESGWVKCSLSTISLSEGIKTYYEVPTAVNHKLFAEILHSFLPFLYEFCFQEGMSSEKFKIQNSHPRLLARSR